MSFLFSCVGDDDGVDDADDDNDDDKDCFTPEKLSPLFEITSLKSGSSI